MMAAAPDIFVGCHDYEGQRGNNIAMILLKIVLPIIYSLFLGGAYGAAFRRKFGYSLMPAYCIQILLLLGSGMLFHNLLTGIIEDYGLFCSTCPASGKHHSGRQGCGIPVAGMH